MRDFLSRVWGTTVTAEIVAYNDMTVYPNTTHSRLCLSVSPYWWLRCEDSECVDLDRGEPQSSGCLLFRPRLPRPLQFTRELSIRRSQPSLRLLRRAQQFFRPSRLTLRDALRGRIRRWEHRTTQFRVAISRCACLKREVRQAVARFRLPVSSSLVIEVSRSPALYQA